MSETFEQMEERSRREVERRGRTVQDGLESAAKIEPEDGALSEAKYAAAVAAMESAGAGLAGLTAKREETDRATHRSVLKGLRSAARWGEAGEILDELAEAGWDITLTRSGGRWMLALALSRDSGEVLRLGSGWCPSGPGAIFEGADLAEAALEVTREVPAVGGEDYADHEGDDREGLLDLSDTDLAFERGYDGDV